MISTLTNTEIALMHLRKAIDLYLSPLQSDVVCSITLAGAAEEVLGKVVIKKGGSSALQNKIAILSGMHLAAYQEKADPKVYVQLRNRARNNLKHSDELSEFALDIEKEAVAMIRRAIENCRKLSLGPKVNLRAFLTESLKRDRLRNKGA